MCHGLALAALLGWYQLAPPRPIVVTPETIHREDVIYYSTAEYLPPLDTGGERTLVKEKPDPAPAKQPILSVPPDADNRRQTIVTPPSIKLDHDVPLPNIVAWSGAQPSVPMAATSRAAADLKIPSMQAPAIAPPPEVRADMHRAPSVQTAVVEPPPSIQQAALRQTGDLNIGPSEVIAPAPQLPLGEQRALSGMQKSVDTAAVAVVPPPPSVQGVSGGRGGGQIIALSVDPAAAPPAELPQGNRRGTFEAGPQGKPGASGAPSASASSGNGGGSGQSAGIAPPGLHVGSGPTADTSAVAGNGTGNGNGGSGHGRTTVNPQLLASMTPPRVPALPPRSMTTETANPHATNLERKVFGDRKFYSLTLNMPNLNSAGGSWVIRFAELKQDGTKGEVSAPVAKHKVDPAYPNELMRRNVEGTVTLYAIIRSDGTVGSVKVLQSIDDQLDEYACAALSRWLFQPGTKNGNAVDLEAVVMIPFRPLRFKTGY